MRWRRFRKWAKWACTIALTVVVAAWATSMRWRVWWVSGEGDRDTGWLLEGGAIFGHWSPIVPGRDVIILPGFFFSELPPYQQWDCYWRPTLYQARPGVYVVGPLWTLFAVAGIPCALLRYADRRSFGPGRCAKCGYSRRGLAESAKCPECGTTPTVPTPTPPTLPSK